MTTTNTSASTHATNAITEVATLAASLGLHIEESPSAPGYRYGFADCSGRTQFYAGTADEAMRCLYAYQAGKRAARDWESSATCWDP